MRDIESILICVLDDDSSQLEAKERGLSSPGWQIRPFGDPDTFLQYAQTHSPDDPARDLLSENELINLIKQYVRTSAQRLFPKRFLSAKREIGLELSA